MFPNPEAVSTLQLRHMVRLIKSSAIGDRLNLQPLSHPGNQVVGLESSKIGSPGNQPPTVGFSQCHLINADLGVAEGGLLLTARHTVHLHGPEGV